ncbi:hypothetical protein [uncultured Robinsoniella sp.]|uniref:hypothetical protein n=1 Tax=uncultured Robinsoniella sp. TaxID=904190 RepID=UPI00374F2243
MAVGRGSIMRAAKSGSKKEKNIEFMTQATESQVEEKSMAEEKQDVKETAVIPADDQSSKDVSVESVEAVNSEVKAETAAVEKPVKKTTRRKTAAKATPAKKKAEAVKTEEAVKTKVEAVKAEEEVAKTKVEAVKAEEEAVKTKVEAVKTEEEAKVKEETPKKTSARKTTAKTTTKAVPAKKAPAKTKAPARAKKETIEEIKEVEETIVEEPVNSVPKNYVGIKDKMPTYLL